MAAWRGYSSVYIWLDSGRLSDSFWTTEVSEVNNKSNPNILRRTLFELHYPSPPTFVVLEGEEPSGGVEAAIVFPRVAPVGVVVRLLKGKIIVK